MCKRLYLCRFLRQRLQYIKDVGGRARSILVGHTGIEPVQHLGIGFTDRFASLAKYCPLVRGDQYRELVCVTGIEPAASRSQSACSTC
jgi:hypothetical protein